MASRRRSGGSEGEGAGAGPNLSDSSSAGMARNRAAILGLMMGYYEEALDALPLERMPALAPRLLDAGVCLGFGDPVSNIIANTLCYLPDEGGGEPVPEPYRGRKRRMNASRSARWRKEVLSKITTGDILSPPNARTVAERSLQGLVTFLTTYYRYLSNWEALRYLWLSRADLLVAVQLIEINRCHGCKDKLRIHSQTVKTALKCAALSAKLPNVDAFLTRSVVLVSHLTDDVPAKNRHLPVQDVTRLTGLWEKPLKLGKLKRLVDHATERCYHYDIKVPPPPAKSLRGILLDRIHRSYLQAISRISMQDFRSRYHQGLLRAGFCYGPFNPVLNIIVNTIWYDTVFPAPQEFEIDMICTQILINVESLSLDGLISMLLACIHDITEHDAMVYLLKSNLEFPQAIQLARQDGYDTSSCRDATAYTAAAEASWHPETEAFVQFVVESLPMVRSNAMELLGTQTLSSSNISELSSKFSSSKSCLYKSLDPSDELTKDALEIVSSYKENFFYQQNFVRQKVDAVLQSYGQTKEPYELRFICALNENAGRKSFKNLKYPYSHVNFWASPKDETDLTLFFAQVSNDDEDKEHHRSFCRPVLGLSTNARCCYCDFQGIRIVHPIEDYCGGAMDFEEMALGMHNIDNTWIISHGDLVACPQVILEENYIYFNPARDVKFIRAMNKSAWEKNLNWGDEIKKIKGVKD